MEKNLINSNTSSTRPDNMVNLRHTSSWDLLSSLGHPCKFQRVSCLGSVTAWHSGSGRQLNFAALNRGCHLYSAGRPSRWALADISSCFLRHHFWDWKQSYSYCDCFVHYTTYTDVDTEATACAHSSSDATWCNRGEVIVTCGQVCDDVRRSSIARLSTSMSASSASAARLRWTSRRRRSPWPWCRRRRPARSVPAVIKWCRSVAHWGQIAEVQQ